jgi:membrane protein
MRDTLPRRAIERAAVERERLREQVRDTVKPVTAHRPVRLFRSTLAKAWQDRVLGLSAEAAFWQLLSIPPLFLGLLGTLGYLGDLFGQDSITSVRNRLLESFSRVLTPDVVHDLVQPTVDDVLKGGRPDVMSIGFVLALWAGSSATATFVNTITIAYDMRDLRGAVHSRLIALWLYISTMIVGVFLLPIMVLGPAKVVAVFPDDMQDDVQALVHDLYWPAVGVILLLGLTSLYHLAIPKRLPWHRQLPGAFLAGVIFSLGSYALHVYINLIVDHAYSYGALAAPIAVLLFLFFIALAILLGAEFNATIEQMWPSRRRERGRRAAKARPNPSEAGPQQPGPDTPRGGQSDIAS